MREGLEENPAWKTWGKTKLGVMHGNQVQRGRINSNMPMSFPKADGKQAVGYRRMGSEERPGLEK